MKGSFAYTIYTGSILNWNSLHKSTWNFRHKHILRAGARHICWKLFFFYGGFWMCVHWTRQWWQMTLEQCNMNSEHRAFVCWKLNFYRRELKRHVSMSRAPTTRCNVHVYDWKIQHTTLISDERLPVCTCICIVCLHRYRLLFVYTLYRQMCVPHIL